MCMKWFLLSGVTGSGKNRLVDKVKERYAEEKRVYHLSIIDAYRKMFFDTVGVNYSDMRTSDWRKLLCDTKALTPDFARESLFETISLVRRHMADESIIFIDIREMEDIKSVKAYLEEGEEPVKSVFIHKKDVGEYVDDDRCYADLFINIWKRDFYDIELHNDMETDEYIDEFIDILEEDGKRAVWQWYFKDCEDTEKQVVIARHKGDNNFEILEYDYGEATGTHDIDDLFVVSEIHYRNFILVIVE